jgi:hypothetical protein
MSKFVGREWRRLYKDEEGDFLDLPWLCRGAAGQLLKIAHWETGIIETGGDLLATVCKKMAVQPTERKQVKRYLEMLIAVDYIVPEGKNWRIRNFTAAQGREVDLETGDMAPSTRKPPRQKRAHAKATVATETGAQESSGSDQGVMRVSSGSGEVVVRESSGSHLGFAVDLSVRNHSGHEGSERSRKETEERQKGEAPPTPAPVAPSRPPEPTPSEPPAGPVSQPRPNASAEPFLAVLRSHPELSGVANPRVAERVEQESRGKFKLEDFARGCADLAAKVRKARDIGRVFDDERINVAIEKFAETAFRDRLSGRPPSGQAVPVIASAPKPTIDDFWTEPVETPEEKRARIEAAKNFDPSAIGRVQPDKVLRPGVRP